MNVFSSFHCKWDSGLCGPALEMPSQLDKNSHIPDLLE